MDVVTGAAGFIGSHLTERLLAEGRQVLAIDAFDDYYAREAKEQNLAEARHHPGLTVVEGDLLDLDLPRLLAPAQRVFHLAGLPGVRGSWGDPFDRYVRNNVLATQRLLESAVRANVERFVYGGSSSAYGDPPVQPTSETAVPAPMSPYGVTKLAAEHLVHLYGHEHRLPTVALRFFTVYGPRQRPDMAFHRFIQAILRDRPIVLYGGGHWRRDFTYVDDIVDGILAAGERGEAETTYNLGFGAPVELLEVARVLENLSGRAIDIRMGESSGGEPKSTWSDSRRAAEQLGYRPKVALAQGLRRQWDWQTRQDRHLIMQPLAP
ncbi:MAG: NAD-dependent epimerase/dehydratase family protein [Thermoplasmata archaeon]